MVIDWLMLMKGFGDNKQQLLLRETDDNGKATIVQQVRYEYTSKLKL